MLDHCFAILIAKDSILYLYTILILCYGQYKLLNIQSRAIITFILLHFLIDNLSRNFFMSNAP